MKVVDKTPLQKENGEIDLLGRLQGTLRYGFSWYAELQAQKAVIAQLERAIEKSFVLIRNLTLPGSEIVVPIILVGPPGVSVMYATQVRGFFEAKGDEWNTVSNGRSQPASVNLISRVKLLARAVQVYLERQTFHSGTPVEAVLIGVDPGFHVESTRPSVRVIMSDAIRQFAGSLVQSRPALNAQQVFDLADRMVNPRTPEQLAAEIPSVEPGPSRAKAIFDAAEKAEPFDPSDLSSAFDEIAEGEQSAAGSGESSLARPLPRARRRRVGGMTPGQWGFLGAIALIECCVVAVGAYILNAQ